MPVTEVAGTDNQFYVAYGNGDAPSNKYVGSGYGTGNRPKFNYLALSALANNVLKNFLSPARYGKGYAAQVHVGDPDNYSYPQLSSEFIISPTGLDGSYEGYLFDYTEGFLFKASSGQVRGDTSDTDSAYTPYNESNKTFGDGNIDPVANNGDDGEAPIDNTALSGYTTPYWISIYRYIGPTGFSHPSASLQADTITASNVQIDRNLNVDGTISIEGINFISTTALSNSGSSVFGDDVSQDTHRFTGSVFISGGLFVDGQSTAGGGGTGAPGIVTSIFPNPSSSTEHGNYKKTSLFPTDSNDVLEYKTVTGLKFSSSIGNPQYIILHGSQSYIETLPDRTSGTGNKSTNVYYPFNVASNLASTPYSFTAMVSQYSNPENAAGGQTYDLFRFTESSSKDYPVLTSYAPFTASKNSYTTHSFELTSSMAIAKIGIFFSRDSETVDNYNATHSIEGIKISGSHDGTTWVGLYNENVLSANESTFSSFTSLPFSSPSNLNQENFNLSWSRFRPKTYTVNSDPEFPQQTFGTPNAFENHLGSDAVRTITKYTTQNFQSLEYNQFSGTIVPYKYYKIHISGGVKPSLDKMNGNTSQDDFRIQYLHHIDLYQDLNLTGSNRKQINISFDEDLRTDGTGFTNFQFAVSNSLAAAGLVIVEPETQFLINGVAGSDLNMGDNSINNIDGLNSTTLQNTSNIINIRGFCIIKYLVLFLLTHSNQI